MSVPTTVVPEQEWNSKREALLVKEKELTHALPNLTHLNARDTTMVFVSAGSQDAIRRYRAAEDLSSVWGLLDITPFGRQEEWQDAPDGVPQDPTGSWVRRHDDYSPDELAGGRTSA